MAIEQGWVEFSDFYILGCSLLCFTSYKTNQWPKKNIFLSFELKCKYFKGSPPVVQKEKVLQWRETEEWDIQSCDPGVLEVCNN
jgi:hypothetical protein